MPDLPRALTRFVERPEPTPAERFEVYLAENPVDPRPVRAPSTPADRRRTLLTLALAAGAFAVLIARNLVG